MRQTTALGVANLWTNLVLHARDDTLVSFEQGECTAKNIPEAQFIPMEKGGHLALMMNINAGAREKLLGFLAQ